MIKFNNYVSLLDWCGVYTYINFMHIPENFLARPLAEILHMYIQL